MVVSVSVLLELLNTTPVVDGVPTELLDGAWLRDRDADVTVRDARELRDDLQRVVRQEVDADVLQRYLRGVAQVPSIGDGAVAWRLEADWAARAVLEWGELQAEAPGRLRPCANLECRLFLIDRTRAGTARWCSMSVCGNRMKARRHYTRSVSDG